MNHLVSLRPFVCTGNFTIPNFNSKKLEWRLCSRFNFFTFAFISIEVSSGHKRSQHNHNLIHDGTASFNLDYKYITHITNFMQRNNSLHL